MVQLSLFSGSEFLQARIGEGLVPFFILFVQCSKKKDARGKVIGCKLVDVAEACHELQCWFQTLQPFISPNSSKLRINLSTKDELSPVSIVVRAQ